MSSIKHTTWWLKSTTKSKRKGRGTGSGIGKTCGRGHKGYKARSGSSMKLGFEGGQTSIFRTTPKSGFTSIPSRRQKQALHKTLTTTPELILKLQSIQDSPITLSSLKEALIISRRVASVKFIQSGNVINSLDKGCLVMGKNITFSKSLNKYMTLVN